MTLKSHSLTDHQKSTVTVQDSKLLFPHEKLRSTDEVEEEKMEETSTQKELFALCREREWLKTYDTHRTLLKLQEVLLECCRLLHVSNKLYSPQEQGTRTATSEQFQLKQRNGADSLKATVVLVGENIIQTEVFFKYAKAPGGVLKTCAQPEVQWKLQQLQDAGNFCSTALNTITKGLELVKAEFSENDEMLTIRAGNQLSLIVTAISDLLMQARSTIFLPRKRTLIELCNFPPTKCFRPPLPPDLVFSYYVSSTRIICAAYQVTSKQNDVIKSLAECELPVLINFLSLLEQAIEAIRELRLNLTVFESHISAYPYLETQSVHL